MTNETSTTSILDTITPDSLITFYPLSIRQEDETYIAGRIATSEFVALPEVGGKTIELLQQGYSLFEVTEILKDTDDVEVDVEDFVKSLISLGFVEKINGQKIPNEEPKPPNLVWLQPHHVKWLFSRPAQIVYCLFLGAAGITLASNPILIPKYQDFFWTTSTSVVIATGTFLFVLNATIHELAHLLAARSLGIPARITLGTRLHHLTAQTDVTGLWSLSRNQRYRVYLAGVMWDCIPISVSILLLAYAPLSSIMANILQAIVLINFMSILSQFHFYIRTDIYFVVMDLLHCYNIFEDALAFLKYGAKRVWLSMSFQPMAEQPASPLDKIPGHERIKVKLYSVLVLIGSTIALAVFFIYELPILLSLFVQAGQLMVNGIRMRQFWQFADGLLTWAVEGSLQLLFVIVFVKNRKHWFSSIYQKANAIFHRTATARANNGHSI
jgi:putative peptide zinc metalloprotease protein